MRKARLAALTAGTILTLSSQGIAHATTSIPYPEPTPHVGIYLGSTFRTTVTVDCNTGGTKMVHTALYNDHFVPAALNTPELVKIYRESGSPGVNFSNWKLVWGGPDGTIVPPNQPVPVTLPYGPAYMAVAVAQGDNFNNLSAKLTANPPTSDNSQLFPSGTQGQDKYEYPASTLECPHPKPTPSKAPTPTTTTSPNCDGGDPSEDCPTTRPSATLTSTTSTSTASSQPSTSGSVQPPLPPGTPSPSAAQTGPVLAHTGSSAVPFALSGLVALILGGLLLLYTRGLKGRSH